MGPGSANEEFSRSTASFGKVKLARDWLACSQSSRCHYVDESSTNVGLFLTGGLRIGSLPPPPVWRRGP